MLKTLIALGELCAIPAASALPCARCSGSAGGGRAARRADRPFLTSELIFPLEHWHNHSSMVVELPGGDLFVCWFHGSGERTGRRCGGAGARGCAKAAKAWSAPFLLADTPGYPDTNATMFLDPKKRLWLMWPTILANEWHTALMKYKIASDYRGDGAPRWDVNEVMHVTPGDEFAGDGEPGDRPAARGRAAGPSRSRPTPSARRRTPPTSCTAASGG